MDLGYARVSTAKQDLERQVDALTAAGIPAERIYLDRKSGATTDRPGLQAVLGYARAGDVIVVHALDRLGRTVRDTLNLIHDLAARGVGIRNLADPIKVDSTNPDDPMAQLAVVMLALFAQMERTYMLERVAHARSVAVAHGRQVGRPVTVDAGKLDYARRLRDDDGLTLPEIVERTGLTRSTLYRHLPPRPADALTAGASAVHGTHPVGVAVPVTERAAAEPVGEAVWEDADERGILQRVTWPAGYRPACPVAPRASEIRSPSIPSREIKACSCSCAAPSPAATSSAATSLRSSPIAWDS